MVTRHEQRHKERQMRQLGGRTVLITGAADGIGRGAALAFAREGSRLAMVDIDAAKLEAVGEDVRRMDAECWTRVVDVSSADGVHSLAGAVTDEFGEVDVLVNVAGVCIVSDIADTSLDDWRWIMGVNLWGPIHTIREFLPGMRERRRGHIVNVSSAGGLMPFGIIGAYSTTKAALVALSGALAQEVYQDGVRVTAFCPGLTGTSIVEKMRFHGYSRDRMLEFWARLKRVSMTPEKTGCLIVDAVKREKEVVVTTFGGKAAVMAHRLFPALVRVVMRRGKKLNDMLYR